MFVNINTNVDFQIKDFYDSLQQYVIEYILSEKEFYLPGKLKSLSAYISFPWEDWTETSVKFYQNF